MSRAILLFSELCINEGAVRVTQGRPQGIAGSGGHDPDLAMDSIRGVLDHDFDFGRAPVIGRVRVRHERVALADDVPAGVRRLLVVTVRAVVAELEIWGLDPVETSLHDAITAGPFIGQTEDAMEHFVSQDSHVAAPAADDVPIGLAGVDAMGTATVHHVDVELAGGDGEPGPFRPVRDLDSLQVELALGDLPQEPVQTAQAPAELVEERRIGIVLDGEGQR